MLRSLSLFSPSKSPLSSLHNIILGIRKSSRPLIIFSYYWLKYPLSTSLQWTAWIEIGILFGFILIWSPYGSLVHSSILDHVPFIGSTSHWRADFPSFRHFDFVKISLWNQTGRPMPWFGPWFGWRSDLSMATAHRILVVALPHFHILGSIHIFFT